jgi:hypothetical protein
MSKISKVNGKEKGGDAPFGLSSGIKVKELVDFQSYNEMQTQGTFFNSQERNKVGTFKVRLGRTYKREYKVISTYTNSKKMVSAS